MNDIKLKNKTSSCHHRREQRKRLPMEEVTYFVRKLFLNHRLKQVKSAVSTSLILLIASVERSMGQIKNPCLQLLSLIVQLLTPIPIEFQDALWPYERYDLPSCMAISRIRTMVLGLKNLWVPTFRWAKGSPLISFPLAKIIFLFKSLPTPLIPKLGLKRLKHAGPTKDRLKRHRSDLIVLDYDRTQNLIGKEKSKWLTMQQTGM